MSSILLNTISAKIEATCVALSVSPDQQTLIATNERSLAQARDNPAMHPLGIFIDKTMVGFTMWEPRTREIASIHRLMIDIHHQRRGYGRQSMVVLLAEIARLGHTTTYLSFRPENDAARYLYENCVICLLDWRSDYALLTVSIC